MSSSYHERMQVLFWINFVHMSVRGMRYSTQGREIELGHTMNTSLTSMELKTYIICHHYPYESNMRSLTYTQREITLNRSIS